MRYLRCYLRCYQLKYSAISYQLSVISYQLSAIAVFKLVRYKFLAFREQGLRP
ncbi:hypothetical protein [Moorena sp. SIO2C4]|uniref:hypothetical protein n=1 Tax=Moorena sp. SIO2C4 TaxID=2607824 RepID=UPI00257A2B28|nr:hypothetical protein [Moorena sp. SIO2C4]